MRSLFGYLGICVVCHQVTRPVPSPGELDVLWRVSHVSAVVELIDLARLHLETYPLMHFVLSCGIC